MVLGVSACRQGQFEACSYPYGATGVRFPPLGVETAPPFWVYWRPPLLGVRTACKVCMDAFVCWQLSWLQDPDPDYATCESFLRILKGPDKLWRNFSEVCTAWMNLEEITLKLSCHRRLGIPFCAGLQVLLGPCKCSSKMAAQVPHLLVHYIGS